jgi:hypothetical protein
MAEALFDPDKPTEARPYIDRVLDLSARYDYDYWLRQQIRRRPDIFKTEEIAERLPFDLTEELSAVPEKAALPAVVSEPRGRSPT